MRKLSAGRSPGDCTPFTSRIYDSEADRRRARAQLLKRCFNYFVLYLDVQGIALTAGVVPWVGPTGSYTNW